MSEFKSVFVGILFLIIWTLAGMFLDEFVDLVLQRNSFRLMFFAAWFILPAMLLYAGILKNKKRRHKNILDDEFLTCPIGRKLIGK